LNLPALALRDHVLPDYRGQLHDAPAFATLTD
jgi:hypothetical protein